MHSVTIQRIACLSKNREFCIQSTFLEMACNILLSAFSYLDNKITVKCCLVYAECATCRLSAVYRQSTGPLSSVVMSQDSLVGYYACCFPLAI